ncbi:transcriptional regulator [Pseudomonas sp.]|uniref:PA3496 family putative envelope integrity protein n=1 Tax=Pseudomonas sp. TaxID=306 RepID=UPI0019FF513E|nr:transcriptional regulator [Pseudomonas sp.]MBF0676822.1 transcriptional regulator [Pseudomonas sp.]
MPRQSLDYLYPLDTGKARRRLEDQRRMRYRRAIEEYWEQRRLSAGLADFPR